MRRHRGCQPVGRVPYHATGPAPGWTETAIIELQMQARAAQHGGDRDKGVADLLAKKQPSQRVSDPSEIGALALWLCDPFAHNATGTTIPFGGGWTAQ